MQEQLYLPEKGCGQQKTIRFIGNMQDNIQQIICSIECECGCIVQFEEILTIFGQKIEKLRAQRDAYRQKYFQDVQNLKNQMQNLEKVVLQMNESPNFCYPMMTMHQQWDQKIILDKQSDIGLRQRHNNQGSMNKVQINSKKQVEIEQSEIQQRQQDKKILTSLQSLIRKYNIKQYQLQNLIKQYISEYQNQFDSQQQKKLYRISKKLEKGIWMKKVKRDIEAIVNAKTTTTTNNENEKTENQTVKKQIQNKRAR